MYEIDLSTVLLIGINSHQTKVITFDDEFIVEDCVNKIVDHSCEYFGSSLADRIKSTHRIINSNSKVPIIVEESRNIIFFPLKSPRDKN